MTGVTAMDRETAARYVLERRAELRWTQADLAREAGVDVATVSSMERSEHWPRPSNRARIEGALGWRHGSLEDALSGLPPVLVTDDAGEPADDLERKFAAIDGIEADEAAGAARLVREIRAARARRDREARRTGTS